jgi:NOL1/NOP2/sun family putative RNA methylase
MIIENELGPGEIGRSLEHLLGYYYVQDIASMLPVLTLEPKPNELILDLAAAPGSKTTQIAAKMKNTGTIIANDVSLGRIKILSSNTERCGASNIIITRKEGAALCKRLKEQNFSFDRILVDAPCSGEGTLRSSPITYKMWNPKTIKTLSRIQKSLISSALEILKPRGVLVYSTCTHAPEENEEIMDFVLKEFKDKIKIEEIRLPLKCRKGVSGWEGKNYNSQVTKSCRIYPQDNDTEGFFLAKFRRK